MKILCIGSHYDDLELSLGGTIAKFCQKNHDVFINIITSSDYINYDGQILRNVYESEKEGIKGLQILGVERNRIECLKYKTKQVPFDYSLIEKIDKNINIISPDLIITHHLSSSHQDHINTAKSTLAASRYQKNVWMFEPVYPDKMHNVSFHSIIYVDISDTFNLKLKSLKQHKSQYKKYPQWTNLVTSLAIARGIENKCKYAEVFEPIKMEYII